MCDYCGCRRIPEIAELCEQHARIQDLADLAISLVDRGGFALTAGLTQLRDALSPLEDDHSRFAALLDKPEELDAITLERFVDELHRHIALEEYELFPAAARLFDPQDSHLSNRDKESGMTEANP